MKHSVLAKGYLHFFLCLFFLFFIGSSRYSYAWDPSGMNWYDWGDKVNLSVSPSGISTSGNFTVKGTSNSDVGWVGIGMPMPPPLGPGNCFFYESLNQGVSWNLISSNECNSNVGRIGSLEFFNKSLTRGNGSYQYKLEIITGCNSYGGCGGWRQTVSITVNTLVKPAKAIISDVPTEKEAASGIYTLGWSKPSGDVSKYILEEKVGSSGTYNSVALDTPTALSYTTNTARAKGKTYYYKLKACNEIECADSWSSEVFVKVRTNENPTISLLDSPHGETHRPDQLPTLYAQASDYNGIKEVNFYRDNGSGSGEYWVGKATKDNNKCSDCFRVNWNSSPKSNSVKLWAEAEDSLGAKKTTPKISVAVLDNTAPSAWLDSPPSTIVQFDNVTLTAHALDDDGTVDSVEFLLDDAILGLDKTAPYELVGWTPDYSGNFQLQVRVTDNEGLSAKSNGSPLTILALAPPQAPSMLTVDEEIAPIPDNTTGNFELEWNLPEGAEYFRLQQLQQGIDSDFQEVSLSNNKLPGHYFSNMAAGDYRFRVFACNRADCSDQASPEISVSVVKEEPRSPAGLIATPYKGAQVFTGNYELSWNVWDSSGGDIQPKYYLLQEKNGGPEDPTDWVTVSNNSINNNYTVIDKQPGVYSYRVKACNAVGCSDSSQIVSLAVLSPRLTGAALSCDDSCIEILGLGIDPEASLVLSGIHNPSIEQTLSFSDFDSISSSRVKVELSPNSDIYKALFELGVRASIVNPNSSRAGITIYGNRATEIIGETQSAPALGKDGTLYVGAENNLFALSSIDGSVLPAWPFETGGIIKATPRVDGIDGTIYVGSLDHSLYAITPDANQKWRLGTGGEVISSVVIDEERNLYFGSMDGFLYAVNAPNGSIKWTYPAGSGIAETPVLAGGDLIYFTTVDDSQIYALPRNNSGTGKIIWESVDDSLLWEEIGDWYPDFSKKAEFLAVARLYRGLLQPPLPLDKKVLTFWTYQLVGKSVSKVDIAEAFLNSNTGKSNFPQTQSNERFLESLYERIFPGQSQPNFLWGGISYSQQMLLDMLASGYSRGQVATLFTQSTEYTAQTSQFLGLSFDYLYDQDYSWAVTECDDGDEYTRDCDGDGLPDWWEILFLGTTEYDPSDDPDGDFVTIGDAFDRNLSPCAAGCYNGIPDEPPLPAEAPAISTVELRDSQSIGFLAGDFKVSETGASTYSIPIELPVGTAGVTPELALSYSSQRGNGLVGQGWNIDGLSSITRCRQTLSQDQKNSGISWGQDDRFCLDGARLILVSDHTYGEPKSQYRTEIDTYVLITAHGGITGSPLYFTVEGKDGSIRYYGHGNKSHQEYSGLGTLSWMVSRFEDSAGNGIDYIYATDKGHRIREIQYAFAGGGLPEARVAFEYEDRMDVVNGYYAGAYFSSEKRLTEISILGSNGESLFSYELDYLDTGHDYLSRVERIRKCSSGFCLPDTVFDWHLLNRDFDPDYSRAITLSSQRDRTALSPRPSDINGDGNMDIIWQEPDWDDDGRIHDQYFKYVLSDGNGYGSEKLAFKYGEDLSSPYQWEMIDYNADGRSDLAIYVRERGHWVLHISQADSISGEWSLPPSSLQPLELPITEENTRFIDINGDGLVDAVSASGYRLLQRDTSASESSRIFYHFGDHVDWSIVGLESWSGIDETRESTSLYLDPQALGDFDADGQVDLVLVNTKQKWDSVIDPITREAPGLESVHARFYLALVKDSKLILNQKLFDFQQSDGFKGDSRKFEALPNERHGYLNKSMQTVDINSDGIVDLFIRDENQVSYQLNTGIDFGGYVSLGSYEQEDDFNWFDFEGDGDLDLIIRQPGKYMGSLYLRRWEERSNKYLSPETFKHSYIFPEGKDFFVDMNGDGVTDHAEFLGNILHLYLSPNSKVAPNVINEITNGLGAKTTIEYSSTSSSAHYAQLAIGTQLDNYCDEESNNSTITKDWCLTYKASDLNGFYTATNGDWTEDNTLGRSSVVMDMKGPQFLVTRVESTAPAADSSPGLVDITATSAVSYFYGRGRMQAGGRGYLGFEKVQTLDEQSGVTTTTTYRQDFPYIGYPVFTEQRTREGMLMSEAKNNWNLNGWQSNWPQISISNGTAALGALQPYISESIEKVYEFKNNGQVQGQLLKTVTTVNEQDEHGNAKRIYVVIDAPNGDNFSTETLNEYGEGQEVSFNNPDHNLSGYAELGRLTKTEVIHSRVEAGESHQATRKSIFTYYDSGSEAGLLRSEVVEPDNGGFDSLDLQLTKNYKYDHYGNKILVEQIADNEESRLQRWIYDNGRFIDREENSYGQTIMAVLERNSIGQPTLITDITGMDTFLSYDAFGRQILEYNTTGAHKINLLAPAGAQCPTSAVYQAIERVAGGGQSIVCFDSLTREVRKANIGFNGAWNYIDTEYDKLGRVQHKSEPYQSGSTSYWTTQFYDLSGKVIGSNLPGISSSNGTTYDLAMLYDGYTAITINPKGQVHRATSNAVGETVRVEDNLGHVQVFKHDAQGNQRFVVNHGNSSRNIVTEIEYDLLGRKVLMSDPDKGIWSYRYNAFGDLVQQTNAEDQGVVNHYDRLGRLIERVDIDANGNPVETTQWRYNNNLQADEYGTPPAAMREVEAFNSGYIKLYGYDNLGRPNETITSFAEGDDYFEKSNYDQYGRAFQIFDAGGVGNWESSAIQHKYNEYGYLEQVVDAEQLNLATAEEFYTVLKMDARGNVTEYVTGNGVITEKTFAPDTGRLTNQVAHILGVQTIQDLTYFWDDLGNLKYREDRSGDKNLREDFVYDELNRLKQSQVSGRDTLEMEYDDLGNIIYKSDVGEYRYGNECAQAFGPNAVCETTDGVSYEYNRNGSMISDSSGRSLRYTTFDKPSEITKDGHKTEFLYGPERKRYLRKDIAKNGQITETRYIGNVEKVTQGGNTEIKRYLPGGALVTISSTGRQSRYIHKDHLGSLDVITDSLGQIAEDENGNRQQFSFDAWGQRRSALDWGTLLSSELTGFATEITTRGFTGHEMLDQVGLIHMNGRIYDPRLAKFLQADSFVQEPKYSQSHNRYAYTWNNPLNATDPSGYIVQMFAAFMLVALEVKSLWVIAVVMGAAAFTDAMLQGASFKDAAKSGLVAGVSAAAFAGIGQGLNANYGKFAAGFAKEGLAIKVTLHGLTGGVMAELQGGKFGHGFVAAGITALASTFNSSQFVGGGIFSWWRVAIEAVIGGTVSKLSGGKFANGAATAAFKVVMNSIRQSDSGVQEVSSTAGEGSPENAEALQKELDALVADKTLNRYRSFTSPDAAATEVLDATAPLTEKYGLEVSGNIWKSKNGWHYTIPKIGGPGSADLNTGFIGYHTHPHGRLMFSNRMNNYSGDFNGGDSSWVSSAKKPLYLGVVVKGTVKIGVCDPGCSHVGIYGTPPSRVIK
ncbi:RHS repeat-associated core domain-containing protein [Microbulbifer sp. SSSA005]|uniref:RHS repeat-associated core domain-containing protein n=1 Tax=Microbulbifer sp. SSSA005 TaxID=3243378 RepID=UPI00403A4172